MLLKTLCQILVLIVNQHICQMSGELRLPLIVRGPKILEEDVNHNLPLRRKEGRIQTFKLNSNVIPEVLELEPKPIIETIDIKSNITNHFDKTSIKCFVKNPSIRLAQEIGFEIELPSHNYKVTKMTLGIHGDNKIYEATHREGAEQFYNMVSNIIRNQIIVVLKEFKKQKSVWTKEATMLGLSAIIPPGEKLFITLEYEGPLLENTKTISANYNNTWSHIVHINPNQLVQNFNVDIDIIEALPIVDVLATVADGDDEWPVLGLIGSSVKYGNTSKMLHVSFYPKESSKQDGGYDMNVQLYTIYGRDKNFLLREISQDITDISLLGERDRMMSVLKFGIDFMIRILFLIPFIIQTQMVMAFALVMSLFLGGDVKKNYKSWYLDEPMWYESDLEYEFKRFDKHLGHMKNSKFMNKKNGIFEDTYDHGDFDAAAFDAEFEPASKNLIDIKKLPVNAKKQPPTKPNNPEKSIFVDYKKLLEATPKKGGVWTSSTNAHSRFVVHEEPLVRKF